MAVVFSLIANFFPAARVGVEKYGFAGVGKGRNYSTGERDEFPPFLARDGCSAFLVLILAFLSAESFFLS